MTRSDLAIPLAVLAGSGLIAVVVSRGFDRVADAVRESRAQAPLAVPAPDFAAGAAPAPAPAARVLPNTPEGPEARKNRVQEQAQFAFIKQHADYVANCWKPKPPVPGQQPDLGGAFELDITFDPTGLETRRVVNTGAYARPPLVECVRATKLPPLHIPPPGEAATVTVNMPIP